MLLKEVCMTSHHQAVHSQESTRLTFELPVIDHKKLKALAALAGVSLKDLILSCLQEHLLSDNIPNEETVRIFKETDEGKNLKHYKSAKDLVSRLRLKKC
jgi:hypothetical protein